MYGHFPAHWDEAASFFAASSSQEQETQMSYTSWNPTFFFCDTTSHVFLLVHNSTCRRLISLPLSLTPVNCLSSWWRCSVHYYSNLRKVLGKWLSIGCVRSLKYKHMPFSKPLFRNNDMSQKAKAILEIFIKSLMHYRVKSYCNMFWGSWSCSELNACMENLGSVNLHSWL